MRLHKFLLAAIAVAAFTMSAMPLSADLVTFEFRDDSTADPDPDRSAPFDGGEPGQGQVGDSFLGFIDSNDDRNFQAGELDSDLTISVVDVIGADGSLASAGAGHEANIAGNQDALGVNDANVGGNESNNLNVGEGVVVSFDQDVTFNVFQFESTSAATEFTLTSGSVTRVFAGTEGNLVDVSTEDLFVPANQAVTLQFTNGTVGGAALDDALRVESIVVHVATAVPEPSSLALVALGAIGLITRRKRA